MVFNVEPAIYREGRGGIRHCDMVAVHADGAELLTPSTRGWRILRRGWRRWSDGEPHTPVPR